MESLSRMTAHDASFEMTDSIPNCLKYPSSCAITMGEQSVSAMMPNRIAFVSGESSEKADPTHPFGRPSIRPATADPPARFRNLRRDAFIDLFSLRWPAFLRGTHKSP